MFDPQQRLLKRKKRNEGNQSSLLITKIEMKSKPEKKRLTENQKIKIEDGELQGPDVKINQHQHGVEDILGSVTDHEFQQTQETKLKLLNTNRDEFLEDPNAYQQAYRNLLDLDDNDEHQIINIQIDN